MMDTFLVNSDSPHAKTLIEKLARNSRDGEIIRLNTREMELYRSDDFQHLTYGNNANPMMTKVKSGEHYLVACDRSVNVDDLIKAADRLGIMIGIVRIDDGR